MDSNQVSISDYAISSIRYNSRQMVGQAGYRDGDLEDIEQELTLYLLENLPRHDPAKSSENTFISLLLKGKVAKMIRRRLQEARDYRREGFSLNDHVEDELGAQVQRVSTITEDDADLRLGKRNRTRQDEADSCVDVSLAIAELPEDLQRIAELLKTERPAAAARILGMPRTTLNRAVERIRAALGGHDLEDYMPKRPVTFGFRRLSIQ